MKQDDIAMESIEGKKKKKLKQWIIMNDPTK